jgi:DNA-binding NarL/FixJ family response regulator
VSVSIARRKAVLVDEEPHWLEASAQVLAGVGVDVVGRAASLVEGTRLLKELRPDLVVVDVASQPNDRGIEWLRHTRRQFPDLRIIVLSIASGHAQIRDALAAGAVAYVVKEAHPDDLALAVRHAFEHSVYFRDANWEATRVATAEQVEHPNLTRRQLEVLRLVSEGMSNAEVAQALWVTEQTVKFHLSNIYRKLKVSNRTEASRWAQLHGLLPPQSKKVTSARAARSLTSAG